MPFRRTLLALLLLSQFPMLDAQQYAFHEDGASEGLNSLTVNYLLQDRRGFLWVGTENGLYEFDGSTYTRVGSQQGIQGTYITSLQQDAAGELWVGTTTALYYGDGQHFRTAVSGSAFGAAGGQQIASTPAGEMLAVSKLQLMRMVRASTAEGWSMEPYFPHAEITTHSELAQVQSVYADRHGSIWLGCGQAICQVRGSAVRVWGERDGVPSDAWCWFLEDSSGRVWARGHQHIRALRPGGTAFADEDIPSLHETIATTFLPIAEDARHRIVTRTNEGLAIWSGGSWQTVGAENGLLVPGILSMVVDNNGALWLGTYGKGVQRWLGYGNWETWSAGQEPGENPVVWSLDRDTRGTLWAATQSGLAIFDRAKRRFTRWTGAENAPHTQVYSFIAMRDGSVWFAAADQNLFHLDPATGRGRHWKISSQLRVRQDSSGRLWILSRDGLSYYDSKAARITQVTDPAVAGRRFYDSCEDRQHGIWFASAGGLVHFADGKFSQVDASGKRAPEGFDSIACGADGTLWLGGTMSGANTGLTHVSFRNGVPEAQELPEFASVEVLFLRLDRRGWIWMGSGSGVYVANGNRWVHITQKDGLSWDDCAENAFFEDIDGSIWIGTSNGLSHLLHPEELFVQRPLRIITVNATLGDAVVPVGSFSSFAWTHDPFQVHMASSALASQSSILYHYRLGGLGEEWATTRSQDLHYSSLPDGKYQLQFYAEDPGQGLRSSMAEISFRMRPPWWKGIYFRLAASALLLTLVYGLLRFRERALRARQAQLEQLVRQRTAELENEKLQLMDAREALREQASRDPLTGLLNYGAIHDVLNRELARTKRDRRAITAVMVDLDLFKSVNDHYGHMAGDEVLREVARRITDSIRPYDAAGRYGGEEFLVILPDFDAGRDANRLEAIHDAICLDPIPLSDGQVKITCSFGVSVLSGEDETSWEEFLDRADKALYRAKRSGRNRIDFHASSISC